MGVFRHQPADQVPRCQRRADQGRVHRVRQAPLCHHARRSRGIVAPQDLQGKKLGAPATDPTFAQWPIFAKVTGIDAAKVAIENVGFPVREPMLAAGEVDAITGCSFTSYVDLKAAACPRTISCCCRWRIMASRCTATPSWPRRSSPKKSPKPYGRSCAPTPRRSRIPCATRRSLSMPCSAMARVQQEYRARALAHGDPRQHRYAGGASERLWQRRSGALRRGDRSDRARPTTSRRRTRPPRPSIGRSCRGPRSAGSTRPPRGEQNIVGSP